jgi:hypothetical protein
MQVWRKHNYQTKHASVDGYRGIRRGNDEEILAFEISKARKERRKSPSTVDRCSLAISFLIVSPTRIRTLSVPIRLIGRQTYQFITKLKLTRQGGNPTIKMSSLPPALNFAETEVGICKKWKEEDSFHQQNKLAEERGDEVSLRFSSLRRIEVFRSEIWNEKRIALPELLPHRLWVPMLLGEACFLTLPISVRFVPCD